MDEFVDPPAAITPDALSGGVRIRCKWHDGNWHEAIVVGKRADNVNFKLHWASDRKKSSSIVPLLPLDSELALPFQVDQQFLPLIYEIMTNDSAEFRRSVRRHSLMIPRRLIHR